MIKQDKQSLVKLIGIGTLALCLQFITWVALVAASPLSGAAQGTGGNSPSAWQMPSFSADQIHTTGKETMTSKVWASGNAMRIEGEKKGKKSIIIMRFDRKVMWSVMPDQRMYLELPWANQGEWASMVQGAQTQRQSLGAEQVGSYHCDKSRLQVTLQGKVYISLEWAAKELNGFVVKTQDEKGQWSSEYQNVKLGAQDPSLFEVPADYRKLSLGGMMQNK
ncbi:MAG TPA: DUF4412 domain-containing protein [Candidatus Angelobacter sp.]